LVVIGVGNNALCIVSTQMAIFKKRLYQKKKKGLTGRGVKEDENQIIDWACQLCKGLSFLHERNIVHRNFKTANILLDQYDTIKIGDIGLTKGDEKNTHIFTKAGNMRSLAQILLDLLTGTCDISYFETSWKDRMKLIRQGYTSNWQKLIEGLMDHQLSLIQLYAILISFKGPLEKKRKLVSSVELEHVKDVLISDNSLRKDKQDSGEGTFKCDYPGCTKTYGKRYTLNRHRKIHMSLPLVLPSVSRCSISERPDFHIGIKVPVH